MPQELSTVGESLPWSYANLAMGHSAVSRGDVRYSQLHYIVRSRLYKGLRTGAMSVGSFADEDRLKLILPQACCYCAGRNSLSIDHLIARSRGGADSGDNMVWSCRSCNSSKCARDMLQWFSARGEFPPLLLLRRYLKLAIEYCSERSILDHRLAECVDFPFAVNAIPHKFPAPTELLLWKYPLDSIVQNWPGTSPAPRVERA
jgi:5-methylcytosine-specific restriction endonuclease McrA